MPTRSWGGEWAFVDSKAWLASWRGVARVLAGGLDEHSKVQVGIWCGDPQQTLLHFCRQQL